MAVESARGGFLLARVYGVGRRRLLQGAIAYLHVADKSGVGYTATLRLECRIQPPVVVTGAFRAQQRLAVPCH
eukprot:scaffold1612_cov202-Prasinococcus_capsulatus_cf.AAC.1